MTRPVPLGFSTMITPARPTNTASHCRQPTRSPSIGTDSAVISSGADMNIVYVFASDSWLTA